MKIEAIDLFCGAGGLTRGLLDAGIDVIAGFDIESSAKCVYEENNIRSNGEKVSYIQKSVIDLGKKDITDLVGSKTKRKQEKRKFLLAGCAPCQPFSMKNKKRGSKEDSRLSLIKAFADLIRQSLPDFVFMENVPGVEQIETDNLEYFIKTLKDCGYSFDKKIVNAVHFGVPQNRKRFVLMASRINKNIKIPNGIHDGEKVPYVTVQDAIANLEPISAGEAHPNIPNHKSSNLQEKNLLRIRSTSKNGGSRTEWDNSLILECHKDFSGHKDVYGRMTWEKPAPTLTTKFFNYSTGRYGHPEQDRAISLREGAMLQSFPKDYIFYEPSIQAVARQIGNAVPPKMAEEFGKYFINII